MSFSGSWIVGAIIGAEVAFWVFLVTGLAARYVLKLRRIGLTLLFGVPLVDLALVVLVGIDLYHGAEPTFAHGLAAVYLGFSVGFGHHVISRGDAWFAHRFAGAPRPWRPPRSGPEKVRHEWQSWLRMLAAWMIAVAALLMMKAFIGWSWPASMEQLWSDELWSWVGRLTIVNIAWFLTGPAYAAFFARRSIPEQSENTGTERV